MFHDKIKLALAVSLLSSLCGCDGEGETQAPEQPVHDCPFSEEIVLDDGSVYRTNEETCSAGGGRFEETYLSVCEGFRRSPRHGDPNFEELGELPDGYFPASLDVDGTWVAITQFQIEFDRFIEGMHDKHFGDRSLAFNFADPITNGRPWGDLQFNDHEQFVRDFGLDGTGSGLAPWITNQLIDDPRDIRKGDIIISLSFGNVGSDGLAWLVAAADYVGLKDLLEKAVAELGTSFNFTPQGLIVEVHSVVGPARQPDASSELVFAGDTPPFERFHASSWRNIAGEDGFWDGSGSFNGHKNIKVHYKNPLPGASEYTALAGASGEIMIALRARYNDYIEETGICGDDLVDLDPCSDAFIDIIPHGEARNDMMDACVLRCYDMGQYPSCAARVECLGEEMGGRFDAETDALCRGLRGGVENPPADQWIWGARMDGNEDWDAHLWMTDGDFLDQGAVNQLFGLFHHTRDPGFFSSEQQSNTCGRTLTDEDVYQCYLPGNDWTPGADEFFEHVMITVPR